MPLYKEIFPEMKFEDVSEVHLKYELDFAFKKRVKSVLEFLNPQEGEMILDLGCGRGFYLRVLNDFKPGFLYGADINYEFLHEAASGQSTSKTLYCQADVTFLPYRSESVDKILISENLEHVKNDMSVLQEIKRVLKPGGIVALTVPNRDYPFAWDPVNKILETFFRVSIKKGLWAGIWTEHLRLYSEEEIVEKVQRAGFKVKEVKRLTHYCIPFSHNLFYGIGPRWIQGGYIPFKWGSALNRYRRKMDDEPGRILKGILLIARRIDQLNQQEIRNKTSVNIAVKAVKFSA
jgi:ubiquinone/menaquinone biosynthesis C-methylase UbiE